MPELKFT